MLQAAGNAAGSRQCCGQQAMVQAAGNGAGSRQWCRQQAMLNAAGNVGCSRQWCSKHTMLFLSAFYMYLCLLKVPTVFLVLQTHEINFYSHET
jgi:hypothetical protein